METETTTLKLYSPITADIYETAEQRERGYYDHDDDFDPNEPVAVLDGEDLVKLKYVILQGIEDEKFPDEESRGLMTYFHGSPSVDEKVISLNPTVEAVDGKLYGVAVCEVKGTLTHAELTELKNYCIGQYADGWGEGAEQRPRETPYGDLYFHFWQSGKDFFIRTAQEMGFEPKTNQKQAPSKAPNRKSHHKKGSGAR